MKLNERTTPNDKPIFKHVDTVKFRIIVVDRHLKPYHMNNIEIKISDPSTQISFQFDSSG